LSKRKKLSKRKELKWVLFRRKKREYKIWKKWEKGEEVRWSKKGGKSSAAHRIKCAGWVGKGGKAWERMGTDSRGGKEVRRVTFWLWRGSCRIFFLMIILLYGIQYVYSYRKSGNKQYVVL
jgi:hypothetical protein